MANRVRNVDVALFAGFGAFAPSLFAPWAPDNLLTHLLSIPLGIGFFFGSAAFGGPHSAPSDGPYIIVAALINATFWYGLLRFVGFIRALRRPSD